MVTSGLGQAAQSFVHLSFEYLRWWRCYPLSGQPVPILNLSLRRFFILFIQSGSPLLWFISIAACPFLVHLWEEAGPAFSVTCSSATWGLQLDPPLAFPFPGWTHPALSASSHPWCTRCASEHIIFHVCPTLYLRRLAIFCEEKHLQKTFQSICAKQHLHNYYTYPKLCYLSL